MRANGHAIPEHLKHLASDIAHECVVVDEEHVMRELRGQSDGGHARLDIVTNLGRRSCGRLLRRSTIGCNERQQHLKSRSPAHRAFNRNRPVHLRHDAMSDAKTESRSRPLHRVCHHIRLEGAKAHVACHAGTVVDDNNAYRTLSSPRDGADLKSNRAALIANRINRVRSKIHQCLL